MKDSENNPIFASLNKSGKGGDILKTRCYKSACFFDNGFFVVKTIIGLCYLPIIMDSTKVIGIQK